MAGRAWCPYGAGGIGSLTQPLLGERIQAALKPNRVVVAGSDDTLTKLAERHGTTVATLRNLNPNLSQRPSDWLPVGSWLFIPRRRAAANAADGSYVMPESFYTPETLAAYLGGLHLHHLQLEHHWLRPGLHQARHPHPLPQGERRNLAGAAAGEQQQVRWQ